MALNFNPPVGARLNGYHPINRGLSGCWLLNEGGGSIFQDITNNYKIWFDNGSFGSAGRLDGAGVNHPTNASEQYGNAISFNGTNQSIDIPGNSSVIIPVFQDVTYCFWAKVPVGGTAYVSNGEDGFGGGWGIAGYVPQGSTIGTQVVYQDTGTAAYAADSGVTAVADTWYFVCGTSTQLINDSTIKTYVNGVLKATNAHIVNRKFRTSTVGWRFGVINAAYGQAIINNVRIYSRILSAQEIMQLYVEPFAGVNVPLQRRYNTTSTGIAFDAASNSGDQAASSNYTFNRTVTGTNTFLSVDVELLTVTGATVTSVTDDDGGGNVAMTFIGARSTVTGAGRIECWGLANPTSGTKAIRVILSASIESAATAASYTGVHQTVPTESFNSNQATNTGSATDATVSITSIADNCWIHAACVANDTSITANQTSRNNVSGTLGSGANEDNNAAVTPPGSTTMSYTGMGITATWAIAGYAIRPLAASGLSSNPLAGYLMLMGAGT